jgi:hypothetical protein
MANAQTAWEKAIEYGCDMSLLEENLRKTPTQRIRAHQRALNTAIMLRNAMEKKHAGHGTAAGTAD